jgi:addiction module HigA family antidote
MKEYSVKRPLKRPPVHPGELLREEVLPALGLSVSEAARRLGVSRQQLHRVLACTHPITTDMALRIGKLAGSGPGLWLRMQQAHDLWHTERQMEAELSKIEPVALVISDA